MRATGIAVACGHYYRQVVGVVWKELETNLGRSQNSISALEGLWAPGMESTANVSQDHSDLGLPSLWLS